MFRRSVAEFEKRAAADISVRDAETKAKCFADKYTQVLNRLTVDPEGELTKLASTNHTRIDCVLFCQLREQSLRSAGFTDIFAAVKEEESRKALQLLPSVIRDLDEAKSKGGNSSQSQVQAAGISSSVVGEEHMWRKMIRGVFAGNIFDLGATASAKLFEEAGASFLSTRNELSTRRCAIDNMDIAIQQLSQHAYKKAILFVDNAGSDVVLGMLPLARALVGKGTAVVLAANSVPSINDITAAELHSILQAAAQQDQAIHRALQESCLSVVESGSDLPVIDLAKVSTELAAACENVDLVIMEGMGRAIETNLHASLTCDKLNLGMIKHPEVAALLGGQVYDCVCKFTPGVSAV